MQNVVIVGKYILNAKLVLSKWPAIFYTTCKSDINLIQNFRVKVDESNMFS
jgi:predicted ATPase